ncbi:prion-inhibition and propagation-domain-containing protein [Paraphoma chrysanthemicola]|nr:prion-inhibition and propagation-domain-containing protein [Paraphoma chrysanthemicola]
MAETTGLVLGTLALVGVFEDCVVLISQIAAAKSMGQDYEILDTKLDIEKTLLLQWADRMHLFEQQRYDERLDDPETQEITKRALGCIRQLLQNGTEFQTRYGMQPVEGDSSLQPTSTISHRLMSNFRKDRKLWQLKSLLDQNQKKLQIQDSAHDGRSGISTLTKIRWVVKDKERFEFLVRDFSDLVASLHRILPPLHHDVSTRGRLQSEIKRVRDVGLLKTVLHASTGNNADLFTETRKAIAEECTRLILDRLWFRLIDDRQDNIAEAFPKTFEWAIHSPAAGLAWADLDRWLRKGRDIYWVSGKPGSGKSTLMKFLYQHPCVEWMLGEWAGERRLTMASFFLWNLGSREQNSQQGLARGLLYHVLNADPSLIPITLPGMWREANSGRIDLPFPSDKEMSQAFARLGTGVKNGAYVFFIDGLDEYVGDYRQGISFVQQLAKSPDIKVLLSSRPIDACVAAFSLKPKLALQDLTKDDIELYVTGTVRSHPYMAELKALDNAVTERLVSDIQAKAAGVFLWVVLACRSLLEGFAAYDNPIELQSRVEELPPELEDLFRHILDRLSPRYLSQAAKLLRICYQSRLLAISDSIPTIALAWIDGKALSIRDPGVFKGLSHEEQNAKCEMLEGRLRSRCIGLLEVHRPATIQSGAHAGLVESSVDFMHRTVFEFLNSPGVWDLDCLQIDEEDFDATLALSYMSSYSLYLQKSPLTTSSYTSNLARQSLIYAQKIDKSYPSHTLFTLRLLALAIMQQGDKDPRPTYMYDTAKSRRSVDVKNHLLNPGSLFFGLDLEHLAPDDAALLLAVEANMANFVRSYDVAAYISSRSRNAHQQAKHYPLLYHGIKKPLLVKIHGFELQHPSSDIVRILLKAGCSPNEQFFGPQS